MKKWRHRPSLLLISLQQFWLNMWTKSFHCSLSYSCNSPRGFWQSCETFENSKLNDVLIIWSGAAYGNIIRRSAYCDIICILKYYLTIYIWQYCPQICILWYYLHIEILSTDLDVLKYHPPICIYAIYIEILSSNLQIEILSQQHIYVAEKCNFQFATKEKKKCDPVSKRTVKPKKTMFNSISSVTFE